MEMFFGVFGLLALFGFSLFLALLFRRVVPTNEVHVVQSGKKTISYGKDSNNGYVYYQWPSWVPYFGVTRTRLPLNVLQFDFEGYEAYDKGRLPFLVDITAFFRISDSNMAAQRVATLDELHKQLEQVIQGAVRKVLANNDLEQIMQDRAVFGKQFTDEIETQLTEWGVVSVKNIELMDIRDSQGSNVIKNIMEKKKSHIEMESRTEVAKNKQLAQSAEIDAQREVDLRDQAAKQTVGLRTIEAQREVSISQQAALQTVKEQERTTKEKEMAVAQVEAVRKAEIERQVQLVKAEQNRQTSVLVAQGQKETVVLNAEAQKDMMVLQSEGQLEAKRREAEGISLEGAARAEAERAMLTAPVDAQIKLANEIGSNKEYQNYLVTIRKVEAAQAVGMEQAKALEKAQVKVIANTGSPGEGVSKVMDLFTSKGGTQVGAMLEALSHTDEGEKLLNTVTGKVS